MMFGKGTFSGLVAFVALAQVISAASLDPVEQHLFARDGGSYAPSREASGKLAAPVTLSPSQVSPSTAKKLTGDDCHSDPTDLNGSGGGVTAGSEENGGPLVMSSLAELGGGSGSGGGVGGAGHHSPEALGQSHCVLSHQSAKIVRIRYDMSVVLDRDESGRTTYASAEEVKGVVLKATSGLYSNLSPDKGSCAKSLARHGETCANRPYVVPDTLLTNPGSNGDNHVNQDTLLANTAPPSLTDKPRTYGDGTPTPGLKYFAGPVTTKKRDLGPVKHESEAPGGQAAVVPIPDAGTIFKRKDGGDDDDDDPPPANEWPVHGRRIASQKRSAEGVDGQGSPNDPIHKRDEQFRGGNLGLSTDAHQPVLGKRADYYGSGYDYHSRTAIPGSADGNSPLCIDTVKRDEHVTKVIPSNAKGVGNKRGGKLHFELVRADAKTGLWNQIIYNEDGEPIDITHLRMSEEMQFWRAEYYCAKCTRGHRYHTIYYENVEIELDAAAAHSDSTDVPAIDCQGKASSTQLLKKDRSRYADHNRSGVDYSGVIFHIDRVSLGWFDRHGKGKDTTITRQAKQRLQDRTQHRPYP
ncbi:hypothetical protein BCV70DRAFT_229328 [Testicularia cyperi]|uniref:Uncharacterized protein n=1 Tax=Testicularia cyperi TaxID=1882483 RepID=A0A317XZX8_9BASI|nr:hypothetical protein BCV70DRAFT_229328 [Testicularia cyperi]